MKNKSSRFFQLFFSNFFNYEAVTHSICGYWFFYILYFYVIFYVDLFLYIINLKKCILIGSKCITILLVCGCSGVPLVTIINKYDFLEIILLNSTNKKISSSDILLLVQEIYFVLWKGKSCADLTGFFRGTIKKQVIVW